MAQATDSHIRFVDTPEYRRLVYRMFRMEARLRPGGRLTRVPAILAWRRSAAYVEAVR